MEKYGAVHRLFRPRLVDLQAGTTAEGTRLLATLRFEDAAAQSAELVAWPAQIYLEYFLPAEQPEVRINLKWFGKNPDPDARGALDDFSDCRARSPRLDAARDRAARFALSGNRHMHAISGDLTYRDAKGHFTLETTDAPVVALGRQNPLPYLMRRPTCTTASTSAFSTTLTALITSSGTVTTPSPLRAQGRLSRRMRPFKKG